jgi:ABC-2 type transport system ATP-binding protein
MPAIEVSKISKRYGAIQALRDVSFSVEKGEVIGLLGPNGAGKSTLMKILTGYIEPDDGDAKVQDLDVVAAPLVAQRRIGYLPESAPLYGEMLVQEYLMMMAALRGVSEGERLARLGEAVRATGLQDRMVQPIGTLSKGYRQRVGIAQAIIHRPDVLILDEPTNGLDPTQIAEIRTLIQRLAERTTVLLSTHILSEVEATCERVVVIMHGTLRADAKLADLRAANAAVIAVDKGAKDVAATLRKLDDVAGVEPVTGDGGWQRFRVTATSTKELTPMLFDAAREHGWRLAELRPDPKTLETVFRDLAAQPAGASKAVAS